MENISKEFTYDLADDQYYQTNELKKTGTVTYEGPAKQYLIVDSFTNKLTGSIIAAEQYETYNDTNDEFYAIEVDCNTDPLICSLVDKGINEDLYPNVSEDIPGSEQPYVRDDPVMPDHTYEVKDIVYNKTTNNFERPFPWKKPYVTWEDNLTWRNLRLNSADRLLSEDLPTGIYNTVVEYKQYLRDYPATFGATFSVAVGTPGTGYSVGDRMLISDPVYKNNAAAPDILITVEEVSDNGGITKITKSSTKAYDYHPAAGNYTDVFYTTSSNGTGATFNMSKVKTVDPWKITPKEPPLG